MRRSDLNKLRPPAYELLSEFLESVLPGTSVRMRRYREELLDFASRPTERSLFLTSVGSGGMEIARLVALLRTTAMLQPEIASRRLGAARLAPGGLADYRLLAGAFAELDASAMREMDVLRELLGHAGSEGGRPGVFERAILLDGSRTADVELTGGFVHIVEPADLAEQAQSALAALSSGVPFPRVGDSDEGEDFLAFDGVMICTSWRARAADGLRPDVARRLAGREIAVPRLSELRSDFAVQVDVALERVRLEYERFVTRATLSTEAARDFWLANRPPKRLPTSAREALAAVDWSQHGEGDGLLQAVRAIAAGATPEDAVAGLSPADPPSRFDPTGAVLQRLESLTGHDDKRLAGRLRILEIEARTALKARLRSDTAAAARLARRMGLTKEDLATQVAQIDRIRSIAFETDE